MINDGEDCELHALPGSGRNGLLLCVQEPAVDDDVTHEPPGCHQARRERSPDLLRQP